MALLGVGHVAGPVAVAAAGLLGHDVRENGGGPDQRGWDWKTPQHVSCVGRGMKMIAPSMARSQHIGKYGGAHCTPGQFEALLSPCYAGDDVPPQDYREVAPCRT